MRSGFLRLVSPSWNVSLSSPRPTSESDPAPRRIPRVSTVDQSTEQQFDALRVASCPDVFEGIPTGTAPDRDGLVAYLAAYGRAKRSSSSGSIALDGRCRTSSRRSTNSRRAASAFVPCTSRPTQRGAFCSPRRILSFATISYQRLTSTIFRFHVDDTRYSLCV